MNDGEVDIQGAGDELLVSHGIRDITLSENGSGVVGKRRRLNLEQIYRTRDSQIGQ